MMTAIMHKRDERVALTDTERDRETSEKKKKEVRQNDKTRRYLVVTRR